MTDPIRRRDESEPEVHAGFIPLTDCAPLVIAKELGFDRQFGFSLTLHREVSWANIRDKVDVGILDCAHMLAPMPIAATLGLGRATEPVIAPMALSLNGNAITVSLSLYADMLDADTPATLAGGMDAARAVAAVARRREAAGRAPLTFGVVFPFSCHNYDLRYWLAAAGVDPDNDVNLVVIPPPLLASSLKDGRVDGFCVGQPWNSVSVAEGNGIIVATKGELWAMSPEKVLGVRETWAKRHPELVGKIVRALTTAAQWLDEPENREEAAHILARREYVGVDEETLARPLTGVLKRGSSLTDMIDPDLVVFYRNNANFPWRSHAVWMMTQMIRWGQVREPFRLKALAERVYRPDLYRAAVAELGFSVPASDYRIEGSERAATARDASRSANFFAGDEFDAGAAIPYLRRLEIRAAGADIDALAALNS
jgi:NitT/TauT family transport system ATP-binding protein/nitrate/nitrite transport system substrate-binding protein